MLFVLLHPWGGIWGLVKALWWKINQKTFKLPCIVNFKGKIICYPDSSYGGLIIYTYFPEWKEMALINNTVGYGDLCVDVGANIGAYSVLFGSLGANVISFEPSSAYERLLENISLNDKMFITPIKKAAYNFTGKINFSELKHTELSHVGGINRIDCIKLDDLIDDYIKYLKIDTEGSEFEVIIGAEKLIKQNMIGIIQFEGRSRKIINYLKKHNFRFIFFEKNSIALSPKTVLKYNQ